MNIFFLVSFRLGLPYQFFGNLFTWTMKKFWQMLVGPFLIFQMAQMTRFRLWLMQVSVHDLWNFCCKFLQLTSSLMWHCYSLACFDFILPCLFGMMFVFTTGNICHHVSCVHMRILLLFLYGFSIAYWLEFVSASHPSATVLIPALRTVGNIVTGDDAQTQVLTIMKFLLSAWVCSSLFFFKFIITFRYLNSF